MTNKVMPTQNKVHMSVHKVYTPKTEAAQPLKTDGKTPIPHKTQTQAICETKICKSPCGELVSIKSKGHDTHKPPANTTAEYLGEKDMQGKEKTQYFVKPKQ